MMSDKQARVSMQPVTQASHQRAVELASEGEEEKGGLRGNNGQFLVGAHVGDVCEGHGC